MTPFSVIELPLLACSVPLLTTVASWRLESRKQSQLSRPRLIAFRGGLVLSALSVLMTASCWIDPYPLTQTLDGGFSIVWLDRAWMVAFVTSMISMILALFGKGKPRILLVGSGVLCLVLEYGTLLQNGV